MTKLVYNYNNLCQIVKNNRDVLINIIPYKWGEKYIKYIRKYNQSEK